jgi:hypothetical protein
MFPLLLLVVVPLLLLLLFRLEEVFVPEGARAPELPEVPEGLGFEEVSNGLLARAAITESFMALSFANAAAKFNDAVPRGGEEGTPAFSTVVGESNCGVS